MRIAVVGMACRYPDASSPRELWENALAGRRAFRRMPDERMPLRDYWSPDPAAPDRFYAANAAVLEGWEFDRVAFKVAGSTFRATDLSHWLALEVAAAALADAGFPMGAGLPHERTAVVVGNTLTGEFSRAAQLRLRWPYVRHTVAAALLDQKWDEDRIAEFLDRLEADYKAPFPPVDEDTLAGSLSNTIAGRICNHFDLRGGGYVVDGACSSSLLSIITACRSLVDGDADVAIAGGVDLSIDPMEVIGFAKTGALATGDMKVYDRDSNGFWPGEGCGMVVLMRESEARAAGHRVYATVAGWGVSSDGKGGITRPEVDGYRLALRRAYDRAGFSLGTVALFEGHGTGTKVGDTTELTALARARQADGPVSGPAAIGSIKAMIGHTKAAAGVAGFIKAVQAVHHEVLPPTVACFDPMEPLTGPDAVLRALPRAEPWPSGQPVRAGVTAMGFGGINTHVVIENPQPRRADRLAPRTAALTGSIQDAELLAFDADDLGRLRDQVGEVAEVAGRLSFAQLGDLAATLRDRNRDRPLRAAVVVTSPDDADRLLRRLAELLAKGETGLVDGDGRVFLGHVTGPGRIGLLFPGQGSGSGITGGALARRFTEVREVYRRVDLPRGGDLIATSVAQPRIAAGSVAGLRALDVLGLRGTVAAGHSLGELAALCWGGAMDDDTLLRLAARRGQLMTRPDGGGAMAGLGCGPADAERLTDGLPVVISGYNGPEQTVVSGPAEAVQEVCRRATRESVPATPLAVSEAFHSPLVEPAAEAFAAVLAEMPLGPVTRRVVSTVTGRSIAADEDLAALLRRQITAPVLFHQALAVVAAESDLLVEIGPGRVLSRLAAAATDVPVVALDTDDETLVSALRVVAAAYVRGAGGLPPALFDDRLRREVSLSGPLDVLANPCHQAPAVDVLGGVGQGAWASAGPEAVTAPAPAEDDRITEPTVDLLRRLAAERAELPVAMVRPESRLLDDLHLSSITVGSVVNDVAARLGIPPAGAPLNFATASVRELADTLDEVRATVASGGATDPTVAGAATWARAWRVDDDPQPRPEPGETEPDGRWRLYSEPGEPWADELKHRMESAGAGAGVLVVLPTDCSVEHLDLALRGAQETMTGGAGERFVLVDADPGAAGLARTLRLERPGIRVTIVHAPRDERLAERVVAETRATRGFTEARYGDDGIRRVPTLRVMPVEAEHSHGPLGPDDVLLVTGGGKGITAECALALAGDSGARLAVVGRSDPGRDPELAANLERMSRHGLTVSYARADVTDAASVRNAVGTLTAELGPVTAVLHGAGRNEPAGLPQIDMAAVRSTFAPKLDGLRNVLAAVDAGGLKLLVSLGSIIGRAGLRGEAHYACANDWMARLTREVGEKHPGCRAICLEWSVWSGVGMGERLSVIENLTREGIAPITPAQGIEVLRRLVTDPAAPPSVVISGRTAGLDTIAYDRPELPLLRFVDRPLVWFPGAELVVETELSAGSDLYLADHRLDDTLLFPAVFGMEAMAQVAGALLDTGTAPGFSDVEFSRPVQVPPGGSTRIRIAATVTVPETVDVVIRSAETRFGVDHFRARLHYDGAVVPPGEPSPAGDAGSAVALDPATDLYGGLLFQGPKFQRLVRYHRAAARFADADLSLRPVAWFAGFLPDRLILGDPGVRDALMHGNQVGVPHATLLPTGIERIWSAGPALSGEGEVRFTATERRRDGDTYVYDVAVRDAAGDVLERWSGLTLRAVRTRHDGDGWTPALLGPYLERMTGELTGVSVGVAVEPDDPADADGAGGAIEIRRRRSARALVRITGAPLEVRYRPDGRPEIDGGDTVSTAHAANLTLAALGAGPVAVDAEEVVPRSVNEWRGLLGVHAGLLTDLVDEDSLQVAATRLWVAVECLQKAGEPPAAPLTVEPESRPGWQLFASGALRIATVDAALRDGPRRVVLGVLTKGPQR
ncbi:SDR family NAD(P)-dependent oxidoreductase [Actinoplanes sp. LDG1-06]|uniref:SDR family NAD(P)-dependent oxidoreductase n=1 Tax=Paractinoplanes ovalisporus TaxID=2810368 RepID=A0ABS2AJT7_9ACTN|nr:type I polyketide synthase [Actinoplanes ovalisporus]MBM2620114.1 SDR family NAD(P)-dependent oxidoreductase [Actinoplanes ovalisporus]